MFLSSTRICLEKINCMVEWECENRIFQVVLPILRYLLDGIDPSIRIYHELLLFLGKMGLKVSIFLMKNGKSKSPSMHKSSSQNESPKHGGSSFVGSYDKHHEGGDEYMEEEEKIYNVNFNDHSPGSQSILSFVNSPVKHKLIENEILSPGFKSGLNEIINHASGDGTITKAGFESLKNNDTTEESRENIMGSDFEV